MMDALDSLLQTLNIENFLREAEEKTLARGIAIEDISVILQKNPEKLPRLGFLHETQGLRSYSDWTRTQSVEKIRDVKKCFRNAYTCWKALLDLSIPEANIAPSLTFNKRPISSPGIELLAKELPEGTISPHLNLALRLAVAGILAEESAGIRLELLRFDLDADYARTNGNWRDLVSYHVARAFVLLCRKADGWADIEKAISSLSELRNLQKIFEDKYIEGFADLSQQTISAVELVGLYHIAQMATMVGDYLQKGFPDFGTLSTRLDRHSDRAIHALGAAKAPLLLHLGKLLWAGCRTLAENSIWSHVHSLGESAVKFANVLMERGRPQPVLELWPSQQEAFKRNLLDPYRKAVIVEMPTSAGKTLLAKFAIVQTKALNPSGTVAYVVPTRALVNQVTFDLRSDLSRVSPGLRVEQAIPAFELDPTESRLLETPPDVLVTTPEKLDLLVRKNHPATMNLVFVVADEIHNLNDRERGARLELLLGTLKRDRGNARFLLLSPFLPNADEIVAWLGDGRQLPPISVDWKPSRRIVGSIDIKGKKPSRKLTFETLDAADNSDVRSGIEIPIAPWISTNHKSFKTLTPASAKAFAIRGGVLVLCRGKGTAITRAIQIAENLPNRNLSDKCEAISAYIEAEVGRPIPLIDCLIRGVAYHHAGMSQETRWLIESLIKSGDVDVVCGTTTLAQGVNFPISTVIVETLQKGEEDLTYQDFWNIAGRAGRALMDSIGVVAFPIPNAHARSGCEEFLRGEAREIISQLATIVDHVEEIRESFDLKTLYNWPSLSPLLQFLAHAMRVAGQNDFADHTEDLLRASLIYHQTRKRGEEAAQKLITLCRAYLKGLGKQPGLVELADQTGFSTPSVLKILSEMKQYRDFREVEEWDPERLFGGNIEPLAGRIDMIGRLPEIRLGSGEHPPFSPERVASILRDWVNGVNLQTLANRYFASKKPDPEDSLSKSNNYIFSKLAGLASWGLAALETVCLTKASDEDWAKVGYIPSLVFYGVRSREAVWLRMVGVPRVLAESLGERWRHDNVGEPESYEKIRSWIGTLTLEQWRKVIPGGTPLKPHHCQILWKLLSGVT
jgi:superfamily II DNA/RNA helicase